MLVCGGDLRSDRERVQVDHCLSGRDVGAAPPNGNRIDAASRYYGPEDVAECGAHDPLLASWRPAYRQVALVDRLPVSCLNVRRSSFIKRLIDRHRSEIAGRGVSDNDCKYRAILCLMDELMNGRSRKGSDTRNCALIHRSFRNDHAEIDPPRSRMAQVELGSPKHTRQGSGPWQSRIRASRRTSRLVPLDALRSMPRSFQNCRLAPRAGQSTHSAARERTFIDQVA